MYLERGRNRLVDLDDLRLEIRLLLLELAIDPLLHMHRQPQTMSSSIHLALEGDRNGDGEEPKATKRDDD